MDDLEVEPSEDGFLLKRKFEAESDTLAEKKARLWAEKIGCALALVKGRAVEPENFTIARIPSPTETEPYLGGKFRKLLSLGDIRSDEHDIRLATEPVRNRIGDPSGIWLTRDL